ncbi:MAG: kinase/pyrophosphorylase [Coriobacteriia bacterium]|nr:kinase/pyrophosphorylase [Coriobacteriia bacterium]
MRPDDNDCQMTLHILSDSIGETADTVAHILAIQFPQVKWCYVFTTMIDSLAMLHDAVMPHAGDANYLFVYTFTNPELRAEMAKLRTGMGQSDHVYSIDVLGNGLDLVTRLTGDVPTGKVGMLHQVDSAYFRRIAAMEFAVTHDDGQHPEGLFDADIILIGVSRTSKTPLSMYLAHRGFKTANLPLTLETEPPQQLFEIESKKIFGLMTGMDTLTKVRQERMSEFGTYVPNYADPCYVEKEFENARLLMRQLGCLIINTEKRAIESIAQEIMTHLRVNFKNRFNN